VVARVLSFGNYVFFRGVAWASLSATSSLWVVYLGLHSRSSRGAGYGRGLSSAKPNDITTHNVKEKYKRNVYKTP